MSFFLKSRKKKKMNSKTSVRIEKESKLSEIAASTLNSRKKYGEKIRKKIEERKRDVRWTRTINRALDSGQAEREIKYPCLCFLAFFVWYYIPI